MIAFGNKYSKTPKSILIAKDTRLNQKIYWVPDQEYPLQTVKGNPLQLIPEEDLLKLFKKYGIKKKEIKKMLNFYEDPEELTMDIEDDFKLKLCFKSLEEMMLNALKSIYLDPTAEIDVWHDPDLLLSIAMIGASNSGKSFLAQQILNRPEFAKKKVYVFSQNPNDPSITSLKKRGKYTIFVDLTKINSPLKLTRDVSPGSILFFDDILELRRGQNEDGHDLRRNLINLINQTMTRGRHHRKNKNSPGCSAVICAHLFKNGHDSRVLWNELQGGLYIYPSSSPHQIMDFLVKKIGMNKTDVQNILKFAKGSRWICFKISGRPLMAAWKTGIYLL